MNGSHLAIGGRLREALEADLGEAIHVVEAVRSTTGTPGAMVETASGRQLVVQRRSRRAAASFRRSSELLRAGGIPAPRVERVLPRGRTMIVVLERMAGEPASRRLGTRKHGEMAAVMGECLRTLRQLEAPGWSPEGSWKGPRALRIAAARWSAGSVSGDSTVSSDIKRASEGVADVPWSTVISHGDYVPVNALMRRQAISSLIDLGDVRLRHPLVDVAWWLLVVRHHHPADLPEVEGPFLHGALAGLPVANGRALASVAILRAAQLLARAPATHRSHAYRLLQTACAWARNA